MTLNGQVIATTRSHVAVQRDDLTIYFGQIIVDSDGVLRVQADEDTLASEPSPTRKY
jgi:hypothetical protein